MADEDTFLSTMLQRHNESVKAKTERARAEDLMRKKAEKMKSKLYQLRTQPIPAMSNLPFKNSHASK